MERKIVSMALIYIGDPACIEDPACIRDPASISVNTVLDFDAICEVSVVYASAKERTLRYLQTKYVSSAVEVKCLSVGHHE